MSTLWKRLHDYKVWGDNDKWNVAPSAWEYLITVKGLSLVVQRPLSNKEMWVVSEKSTGLRITKLASRTRNEALYAAILVLERYTDETLRETVESNVILQVKHQLGA